MRSFKFYIVLVLKPILMEGLLKIREWFSRKDAPYLRSIFDQIGFRDRDWVTDVYYVPPTSLTSKLPHPVNGYEPTLDEAKAKTLDELNTRYRGLSDEYLGKFSINQLLFLLEKFGGTVPIDGDEDISVFDTYKIKSAKAIIALNRDAHNYGPGSLMIDIDLSGIQKFIYTIASRGALKNLRSRSFFIELLCNHTINRVINAFNLHPVNILINGGGNVDILASKPLDYKKLLDDLDYTLNLWLSEEFNGRLHVVFTAIETDDGDFTGDISDLLKKISQESFKKKNKKFHALMQRGKFTFVSNEDPEPQRCDICQKDYDAQKDQKELASEDIAKCAFCDRLVRLGNHIPKAKYVYILDKDGDHCLPIEDTYYKPSECREPNLECAWVIFEDSHSFLNDLGISGDPFFARTYTVTAAMLPDETRKHITEEKAELQARLEKAKDPDEKQWLKDEISSLPAKDEDTAMLEHLADSSEGANFIGALRMDADNIGKILRNGFNNNPTIEKISSFSRNLSYFFKLYLESICGTDTSNRNEKKRLVHVIYAGGDDLFALGAWNDIAQLSLDVGEAFKEYTCQNIDLGLSGGFTIHRAKYPVSQMANLSLMALQRSKENWEPCWFCMKNWMSCPLFRDGNCLRKDSLTPFFTEYKAALKFRLDKEHAKKYLPVTSRLKLDFKRQRFIGKGKPFSDEADYYIVKPLRLFTDKSMPQPTRGFLHNVLSTLEIWYSDGLLYLPRIAWLVEKQRQHLGRTIEKQTGATMYELYDRHLHIANESMLSALHIPLSWAILLMREGGRKNESKTYGRETFGTMGP